MEIKPVTQSIKGLLSSRHQFVIPRFQREYSWERKNNEVFLRDIISNIEIRDGKLVAQPYFVGTMLFVGDFSNSTQKEITVVDGQQRLTTITIIFSVLSDVFQSLNEDGLSEAIFNYILTPDDEGSFDRTLLTKTSFPFFSFYIQHRIKDEKESTPTSEEEMCIKETYFYFRKQFEEKNLRKLFEKNKVASADALLSVNYLDMLKAIREQILACVAVTMSFDDGKQAYRIFEILNGKGKMLQFIDLIKNKIFETLQQTKPDDFAEIKWNELRKIVSESSNSGVGLATFYRHYWQSKYGRSGANQLYEAFKNTIDETESSYKEFLRDLLKNAKYYMKIVHPKREDYSNRKQYYGIVHSFNVLSNFFAITQVRVVIMSLMECKERNLLHLGKYVEVVRYLEDFHFAYTALMTNRSNVLDPIYSKCAVDLRNAADANQVNSIIQEKLYNELDKLFPDFDSFKERFVKLEYTKHMETSANVRCKYVLQRLNCYYEASDVPDDQLTIEHLLPEKFGGIRYNIGNLIALEDKLNNEAGSAEYSSKLSIYGRSRYKWMTDFTTSYPEWDESMIDDRAAELAKVYYYDILKRPKVD